MHEIDRDRILVTFSQKIIAKRYEKSLSQQKLAKSLGVHVNTISTIERGLSDPNFTTVLALAKTLQLSLDEFADLIVHELNA